MAKPGIETIAESATWLSIVSQLYNGRMAKLLEPHGMTLGQFSILHHIARPKIAGDTRISDIAEAVLVEQPAVTKAIAKFDSMGLVELTSCPLDKRAKLVTATTKAATCSILFMSILAQIYSKCLVLWAIPI